MTMKTITRQQLCDQGLNEHQALHLTQCLTAHHVDGGIPIYCLRDVITEVRHYLTSSHLQPPQREAMSEVLASLLQQLDNVVVAPFGLSRDQQIGFYIQKLLKPQTSFVQSTPHHAEPANVVLWRHKYPDAMPNAGTDC